MRERVQHELSPASLEAEVSAAEWEVRVNLAAAFRVAHHFGWNDTIHNHMSAKVPDAPGRFVMNPQGLGWHEVTASSLITADVDGQTHTRSELRLAPAGRNFHSAILAARGDVACVIHIHPQAGVVISATRDGLKYFDQRSAMLYGRVATHDYEGLAEDVDEGRRIVRDLGDKPLLLMWNHGLLAAGRTIGEAFTLMHMLVGTCEAQAALMATGAPLRELPPEICEHTQAQIWQRYQGRPYGDLDWNMYRRLADRLDPGYAT